MNSILEKFVAEIQQAIGLITKHSGPKFKYKGGDFKEVQKMSKASMNSAQLGEYERGRFVRGTANVHAWVLKAQRHAKWPKNVKYSKGILYVELETRAIEPVIEAETEVEETKKRGRKKAEVPEDDFLGGMDSEKTEE